MSGPKLVTDPAQLSKLTEHLSTATRIACDTEAASFHRYHNRVFLIQLSSDDETAVIDPLAFNGLSEVGDILTNESQEIVFHDADFDLRSLHRDYGWEIRHLFDTRIAAQLLGEKSIGLGALLEKYFEIKVDKRFQRADWSKRPLDPEMLEYAAGDTAHLLELRDELAAQLEGLGRMEWAREEFRALEGLKWDETNGNGFGFLKLKGLRGLDRTALGILKALYEWREAEASEQDRPTFRIVANESLVAIARTKPETEKQLLEAGVPKGSVKRYGQQLLEAARAGKEQPFDRPKRPRNNRNNKPLAEGLLDGLKKMRDRTANELGLEPGVLCPNGTLHAIARAAPRSEKDLNAIPELRAWQTSAIGPEKILENAR